MLNDTKDGEIPYVFRGIENRIETAYTKSLLKKVKEYYSENKPNKFNINELEEQINTLLEEQINKHGVKSFAFNIKNGVNDFSKLKSPDYNVTVKVTGPKVTVKLTDVNGPINHVKIKDMTGREIGSMVFDGANWSFTKDGMNNGEYAWYIYAYSGPVDTQNTMRIEWTTFEVKNGL